MSKHLKIISFFLFITIIAIIVEPTCIYAGSKMGGKCCGKGGSSYYGLGGLFSGYSYYPGTISPYSCGVGCDSSYPYSYGIFGYGGYTNPSYGYPSFGTSIFSNLGYGSYGGYGGYNLYGGFGSYYPGVIYW